jgi:hypothetical protein
VCNAAYLKLRDADKAAMDLNKAAQLDPNDKAIQLEIRFSFLFALLPRSLRGRAGL